MNILGYTFGLQELLILGAVAAAVLVFVKNKLSPEEEDASQSAAPAEVAAARQSELPDMIVAEDVRDKEIIAAITAALAVVLGDESNGLVVRSIKRISKRGR